MELTRVDRRQPRHPATLQKLIPRSNCVAQLVQPIPVRVSSMIRFVLSGNEELFDEGSGGVEVGGGLLGADGAE